MLFEDFITSERGGKIIRKKKNGEEEAQLIYSMHIY